MDNYSIGIDLGGTKILAGLVNTQTGEVISYTKKKTKKERGSDKIIKRVINVINELLETTSFTIDDIKSIGIGIAGQVDREKGVLISAPNLDCQNVDFKKILEDRFNKSFLIGNDVEVATIGELLFGTGKKHNNFVCVFVGTGVGSGIVMDGKLYTGVSGTAGEIGHIIVSSGGRACGCGANGCLEAYASRTAIEQIIKGSIKKGRKSIITDYIKEDGVIRSKFIKLAFDQKDEVVLNCLTEAAEYLSTGLASVINFLNPEMIIMGGGLINAIDSFYDLTKRKTIAKCLPTPSKNIKIEKTKLGDFSGVVGAALLDFYRNKK